MNIHLNQISVNISKGQLATIVADILTSTDNASLLRVISPALADKFSQFPEFTNINLEKVNEDGSASVILKIPQVKKVKEVETTTEEETTEEETELVDSDEQ